MKIDDEKSLARLGLATRIQGIEYSIACLQAELDEARKLLSTADEPITVAAARKVRAAPAAKPATGRGWPEDPEERRQEMARRMANRGKKPVPTVALAKRGLGRPRKAAPVAEPAYVPNILGVRDVNHPDHEAWARKNRRKRKKMWADMTPQQREERLRRMAAGRKTAKNGELRERA